MYQLLENRVTNNTARIIDIEIGKVLTDCNEVKDLKAILNEGFIQKCILKREEGLQQKSCNIHISASSKF